jgi:hypothetical protein
MSIANLATVRVAASLGGIQGDDLVNVFEFRNDSGVAVTYEDTIAQLRASFGDLYQEFRFNISVGILARTMSFWDVAGAAPMGVYTWDTFVGGEESTQPLPQQVAGFVFFRTHKSRCIGKKFVPGPCEAQNDADATPTNGYRVALQDWADGLMGLSETVDFGDWTYVIRSTVDNQLYVPYAAFPPDVWSTLRRRRIGRGS